jgi:RNA ligase (TIGR02306 family)
VALCCKDKPEFEFLKARGNRIKTIKLRGQVSQGICFPLNVLPADEILKPDTAVVDTLGYQLVEGDDVTELMGIIQYEVPIPATMAGKIAGLFPAFIPKTDETRIQAVPEVLTRNTGTRCYVTEKIDGCSITAWVFEGVFGVASRNMRYYDTPDCLWWNAVRNTDLPAKILTLNMDIAFQGEILGNVQGNKYKRTKPEIYWFNVFDIRNHRYMPFEVFKVFMNDLKLPTVPVLDEKFMLNHTVDELVEYSRGKSALADINREGVVIRSITDKQDIELGRLSFKVINPDFLLKYSE